MSDPSALRTSSVTVFAILYLIGAGYGALLVLSSVFGMTFGLFHALGWIGLMAQIGAAFYGAILALQRHARGVQLLYWVSLSSVPMVASPLLDYYAVFLAGVTPNLTLGAGRFGAHMPVSFGYAGLLQFFTGGLYLTIGVNLVGLYFTYALRGILRQAGVPPWPLQVLPSAPAN